MSCIFNCFLIQYVINVSVLNACATPDWGKNIESKKPPIVLYDL